MAYKTDVTQSRALDKIDALAERAKVQFTQFRAASAAGNVTLAQAMQWKQVINNIINEWDTVASTPGLKAYAASQRNDPGYDIEVEYAAMSSAANDLKVWLDTNIPAMPTYTSVQTAGFRTACDAFLTTIE